MADSIDNNEEQLFGEDWFGNDEGQLSVDVVETPETIIIRSAIAGVKVEDLDISATTDTVTIRGRREKQCTERETDTVHIQECYWGNFSRSVVLPAHVRPEATDAVMKNGILTVTLKKVEMSSGVKVLNIDDL